MPASKYAHVLAVLRKHLSLNQSELAKMVRCSVATIQSIELNRLQLSDSLAAQISIRTGVDIDWLLNNDLGVPMPPLGLPAMGRDITQLDGSLNRAYTMRLLSDLFSRLFAAARSLGGSARKGLELSIADELTHLRADPLTVNAGPRFTTQPEIFDFFKANPDVLPAQLRGWLDLEHLGEAVDSLEKPKGTALPRRPRKAPSRIRRSA
jgi:transcriptional regulator with XRE-family HTH domain